MKDHIIINNDRTVIVPASVYKIGNQYEHNVNKVTFDCPRYADDEQTIDLSAMKIYINYIRPDKKPLSSLAENVIVDETDPTIIHFDFRITRNVTFAKGVLSCLVCIKSVNSEGIEEYHWNSDIFTKLTVGEGMENEEVISEENSDLITKLLLEVDTTKAEVNGFSDRIDSVDRKVGSLDLLSTEDKSSIVSAVNEVKEGYDELKGDLGELESCSASKIIAKAKDTDESGFNYYYDGSHQDSTYFKTTDFINVSSYETITVTDKTTSSSTSQDFNAHICFYDANKQYVSGVHRKVESPSVEYSDTVSIPSNVVYAKISYLVSASDIFKVEAPIFICEKLNDNTNKISEIYPIKDAMEHREHSRNWFDDSKASVTSESGVKGYISDYIPVVQGDVLYASKNATRYFGGMSDEAFFLVRYYNESKQNISNSDYWQLSVTVPSGVSYARCYVGQYNYARIMIEKNVRTNIWEEYWDSGYIANDVNARNTSDVAIDSFLYGSVSMFDRIGAIGDSYTAGYAKASDGTYNTNIDHSYIGVMAKRAGINYANYGHSGATTRSYLTDKLPSVLSDSTCDFYFLALGINDVGLGTSYIGTVADINDDYTQNADTFYGNYGKIIAQVKAHSPKALFCLIKVPLCGTNVKEFSSAIEGIGEHFGIPVIDPYDDEFFKTSVYENMNDGHPTLLGYTGMALAYERLLSKAIYDNPTYFKFATIG